MVSAFAMLNQEVAQALNVIKRNHELIVNPSLSENPLENVYNIEIADARGIRTDDLRTLVSALDENKSLYGTNYDLVVRFKSR